VNGQPDSPLLGLVLAAGCAAASWLAYRVVRLIEANRILPLSSILRGDKGIGFFRGTWPFVDKYQVVYAQRSMLHVLCLVFKWVLAFVACLVALVSIFTLVVGHPPVVDRRAQSSSYLVSPARVS
jgi:hypothetical protein